MKIMKKMFTLSFGSKTRRFAFALASLLIVSVGWAAKIAVDRIGDSYDQITARLNRPSQVYLWCYAARERANPVPSAPPSKPAVRENPLGGGPLSLNVQLCPPARWCKLGDDECPNL